MFYGRTGEDKKYFTCMSNVIFTGNCTNKDILYTIHLVASKISLNINILTTHIGFSNMLKVY